MRHTTLVLVAAMLAGGCHIKSSLLGGSKAAPARPAGNSSAAPEPDRRDEKTSNETGAPAVAAAPITKRPAWCKKDRYEGSRVKTLQKSFENPDNRHDFRFFLGLSRTLCNEADDPEALATLAKMRATVMRELELSDADLADIHVPMAMSLRRETIGYSLSHPPDKKAKSLAHASKFHQAGRLRWKLDINLWSGLWAADALGSELAQHTKLFIVRNLASGDDPLKIALALYDMRTIDRDALWRELDDDSIPADQRIHAKFHYGAIKRHAAALEKKLAKMAAADPGYKALFFTFPAEVARTWKAIENKHGDLVALARDVEFGHESRSRKAMAGCGERAVKAIAPIIKRIEIPQPDSYRLGVATTDLGFLASVVGAFCDRGPIALLGGTFRGELSHVSFRRGPRTALLAMISERASTLKFDDLDTELRFPRDRYKALSDRKIGSGSGSTGAGEVKSVKKRGKTATITFAHKTLSYPVCKKSKRSKNRWKVDPKRGTIERDWECVKYGSKKFKVTEKPIEVPAPQARHVKRGRFVKFVRGKKRDGAVISVFKSPRQKRLISLFGIKR